MKRPADSTLRLIDAAGLGACVALSAGVFFLAVKPVLAVRAAQRLQAAELSQREAKANELMLTLSDRRHTLQQTEQQVASRSLKLVPLGQLNQRLSDLTQLAEACEMSLDQVEPGEPAPGTHYVSVPVHLAGRGGYAASTAFLEKLHAAWPDLAVVSLDLEGNPRVPDDQPRFALDLLWFAAPGR